VKTGAGNDFFKGEGLARNDFDTIIRHRIQDVIGGWADIVVSIAGLGGGTGNGSVPYLIHEMKHGDSPIASEDMHQFSVAIWPSENESLHRQFNAVGGLSRLLRFGEEGRMNADAVILCDNTTLVELVEEATEQRPEGYREINNRILQVLDGLISPSRRAVDVIDAKDYVKQPHDMGVQHFTAGMSLDNYTDLLTVEGALDIAAENTLTPVDPETALACYCVVEVPADQVGQGEFTPHEMGEIVQAWTDENTAAQVVYDSIVPREDLSNTFNALVFLGGFDLEPFLEPSLDAFEQYMSTKEISLEGVRGQEKRDLEDTLERGRRLRERLDNYLAVNRKQRAALGAEV
jgi:cell division GTPase FtsZ